MTTRSSQKHINALLLVTTVALLLGVSILISSQQKRSSSKPLQFEREGGQIISGEFNQNKQKSNTEWKKILNSEQYHILREAGTEIPFTGELNNEKRKGTYYSVGCDTAIFRSEQKFDSGTGWPSFWAPIDGNVLVLRKETGLGDDRIEVLDPCGGHLGHVFDDGPQPTGKRYCINSIALKFVPDK